MFASLNRVVLVNLARGKDTKTVCHIYMAIKLLSICIILVQMLIINQVFGADIFSLGYRKLITYIRHLTVETIEEPNEYYQMNSPYFPLKSVCVFRIRELTSTNSYAVVCTLPINLFIQFAFFVLSLWYLLLAAFNLVYMIKWWTLFKRSKQTEYIQNMLTYQLRMISRRSGQVKSCFDLHHLETATKKCHKCELLFTLFYDSFLSSDLVFMLRIISLGSGKLLVENILVFFWKIFIDYIQSNSNKNKRPN